MTTAVDLSAYPPSIPDEHHQERWDVRTVRIVIVDSLKGTTLIDGFGPKLTIAQLFHHLQELPLTGEQESEMECFEMMSSHIVRPELAGLKWTIPSSMPFAISFLLSRLSNYEHIRIDHSYRRRDIPTTTSP